MASAWEIGLSPCSWKYLYKHAEVESFCSGVRVSLILVEVKEEVKKPIMVWPKRSRRNFILSPRKQKFPNIWISLKKHHHHHHQQQSALSVGCSLRRVLLFIYFNDGTPIHGGAEP